MIHKTLQFPIEGMSCGKCVKHVTAALQNTAGVKSAEVTLNPPVAKVEIDDVVTTPAALAAAVEEAGYRAKLS